MAIKYNVIAIISAIFLSACSPQTPSEKTIEYLLEKNQAPAYQAWAKESAELAKLAGNYCQQNNTSLEVVQQQWRKTRSAWSTVLALPMSDLQEQSTLWQIQFWPDKKNLVDFQFKTLLKNNPPQQPIGIEALEKSSTALRGLGASEYLLFDTAFIPETSQSRTLRCTLLVANTRFQQTLSAKLQQSLQSQAEKFLTLPNATYANSNDALAELLRNEILSIESLKKRLVEPLPAALDGQGNIYAAEFWRSDDSLNSFRDAVNAHEKLWKHSGWESLIKEKKPQLANDINQHYADLYTNMNLLHQSMNNSLTSQSDLKILRKLKLHLRRLERAYSKDMAKTLGVQIGFNANDGD